MTHSPRPLPGEQPCEQCGAPLAGDQHWCVICGARRASARTDALALLLGPRAADTPPPPTPVVATPTARAATAGRRRRAALPVALATLVGLVVVTGSNVPASLAGPGQSPFTVVLPPQVAAQVVAQAPPPAEPAPLEDTYEEPPLDEAPLADTAVEETPAATAETPSEDDETPPPEDPAPVDQPEESPIRHVFMIVLGSTDVAALAKDETAAPYLAGTLAKSGTLLSDYRTVARGALANRIALVSGQGPTQQTLADCTTFADVRPADALPDGQTGGDGCVYGYETGTLGDQLRALERTWRTYMEPAVDTACRTDAETTRRNPFLWFRGTFEADDCDERNAPLSQLERDLRDSETTPALSYIASDAQQGSAEADAFLERVVPGILNSLAYANGGLIVITSDQPPAAAPAPTPPAATTPTTPTTPIPPPPAPTPVEPPPATTPVEPPATTPTEPPLTTPTTPTTPVEPPVTTPTTPEPPPTPTTPTTPQVAPSTSTTPAAGASGPLARTAADTAPDAGTPTPVESAPGPSTYANVGDAVAAGAGIPVGALLISPYTPSGRVDRTPASAFTLLRTLSEIFGVDPLGYAAARGRRASRGQTLLRLAVAQG